MRRRRLLLMAALLLIAGQCLPLQAQHRWGSLGGFGHGGGFGFGGWGHGGFGFGGWNNYPPYPYPAPMPRLPVYVNVIVEATHDWRFWSPTTKVIAAPIPDVCVLGEVHHSLGVADPRVIRGSDPGASAVREERVIGMGAPLWASSNFLPLGDMARRYRTLAAAARSHRPVLTARN